jgi:Mg2+ and Co2+ transporter CorA
MTIDYVKDTLNFLESLFQENTQRELNTLKFITLIAAITSFFGMNIAFPWDERWHEIYVSSFTVVAIIAVVCFIFYFVLKLLIYNRYFTIQKKKK